MEIVDISQIDERFKDMSKDKLDGLGIKFLVRFSIAPKYDQDKFQFKFVDLKMKENLMVRALPELEIIIAIPATYPSN